MPTPDLVFKDVAIKDIPRFMDEVRQMMVDEANLNLDEQIDLGNSMYTTLVDSRAVPGRNYIGKARKSIKFNFLAGAVDLAIGIMARMLHLSIKLKVKNARPELHSDFTVMYGNKKDGYKRINTYADLEEFQPGDVVMIYPNVDYQVYLNYYATQRTKRGFFGEAARRIRSRIRQKVGTGNIMVFATRTRGLPSHLLPKTQASWGPASISGWVIIVKYRKQQFGVV